MNTKILDILAVIIQLSGTLIMFFNSPENKPEGVFFGDGDTVVPNRRNKNLKRGLVILSIGFFIQLISIIICYVIDK